MSLWVLFFPATQAFISADCTQDQTPQPVIESGFHRSVIRGLIFSADGRQLVSVSDDKTIRVWSVADFGRKVDLQRVIRGPICSGRIGAIYGAALSPPDSQGRQRWLAVAGCLSDDPDLSGTIRLHDFASGKIVAQFPGHRLVVNALAFHPKGRWLASAGKDGTVRVWDLKGVAGDEVPAGAIWVGNHAAPVYDLAWSSDGRRLASASYDGSVGLWNTIDIAHGRIQLVKKLAPHQSRVRTVAFHPDGNRLVSGDKAGCLYLWDAADGDLITRVQTHLKSIAALTFSPRGDRLICGNDDLLDTYDRVALFAYPSLQSQGKLTVHDNVVVATAVSPDARLAASAGGDRKQIVLWDLDSRSVLTRLDGGGGTLFAVGMSPDRQSLYWGWQPSFENHNRRGPLEHTFDLQELQLRPNQTGPAVRAQSAAGALRLQPVMDPQTHYLDRLRVEELKDGRTRQLATLTRDQNNGYQHSAYSINNAADAIISGGFNGSLALYTTSGTLAAHLTGHEGEIKAVTFSADGKWAVSGGFDQVLRLWRLPSVMDGSVKTLEPALSLFATDDGRWTAWTPRGYYACSTRGSHLIGHLINQGPGRLARYVSADQLYAGFYNPAVVWAGVHDAPEARSVLDQARQNVRSALAEEQPANVRIISPSEAAQVDVRQLPVRVQVSLHAGPGVELEWRVNHQSVGVDTIGLDEERDHQRRLPLAPGHNLIEVLTRSGLYKIESQPARLEVFCNAQPDLKPRLCMLAVGIDKYEYGQEGITTLKYAVSDARSVLRDVARISRRQYDFYQLDPLIDENASYEKIKEAFVQISRHLKPDDVFMLFLAGHGAIVGDRFHFFAHNTRGIKQGELANTITQDDLRQWLLELKATRTLVMIDACQSGGIQLWPLRSQVDKTAVDKLGRHISRNLIASASFDEMASEGYHNHGVFTHALLEAFFNAGIPSPNGMLKIKVTSVVTYVEELVPRIARETFQKEQTPYHHLIGTDFSIGLISPLP